MDDRASGESASGHLDQTVRQTPITTQSPDSPIIGPGYTYASVTDKISAIVLTGRTPRGWLIGFVCVLPARNAAILFYRLLTRGGCRDLGS